MSKSCREAFPNVREWSRGHWGFAGVVGRPSRMSGNSREALPDIWKRSGGSGDMWEWSGGPPGCLGVVRGPSRMAGSGRESLTDV